MLNRLFRRNTPVAKAMRASVPSGQRVYAIGDIHGRDDLFASLLSQIDDDDRARGDAQTTIILLGDLIDRGPHSAAVVARAIDRGANQHRNANGPTLRWLIGNHEEVFLKALGGDPKLVRYFVRIGGAPTIHSYGLAGDTYDGMSFEQLAEALPGCVPQTHRSFLASGEDQIAIGDYLFVHAGVRPGVPFDQQTPSDLRWIREDFMDDRRDHGKIVIHGHTITDGVDEQPNRIGIDTGAYASGALTAIGLEGDHRWYLST